MFILDYACQEQLSFIVLRIFKNCFCHNRNERKKFICRPVCSKWVSCAQRNASLEGMNAVLIRLS